MAPYLSETRSSGRPTASRRPGAAVVARSSGGGARGGCLERRLRAVERAASWYEDRLGGGAGKAVLQDFHFGMATSKASPNLMLACATGEAPPELGSADRSGKCRASSS